MNLSQLYPRTGPLQLLSNGTCKIKITAADRNKLSRYCYVCVTGCTTPVIQKVITNMKYIFWMVLIRTTGMNTAESFTLKTDNPDINSLDWKTSNGVYRYVEGVRFADVNYLEIRDDLEVAESWWRIYHEHWFQWSWIRRYFIWCMQGKLYKSDGNSKCVASIPTIK